MTIDIPFEIGDPVLIVRDTRDAGPVVTACMFSMSLVDAYLKGNVFRTIKEAQIALEEANGIHEKS